MSKLDGNERWKTKMLLTEHADYYEENQHPDLKRQLTSEERVMVRDYILLPHIATMIEKSLVEIGYGSNVLRRTYQVAGQAIQRRVMQDIYQLKRDLKQRNIKVVPTEQEDFVLYHTIHCRSYAEKFGITRDEMRTQISLRLTKYTSDLAVALTNQFK